MTYCLLDSEIAQLYTAVRTGGPEDIRLLVDTGVDINLADRAGETALHVAAVTGNTDVAKALLHNCADTDKQNQNGQTPLHLAAKMGFEEMVSVLIKEDCNMNLKTKYTEMTALHLASQNGHTDIVQLLMNHGADPNVTDVINKPAVFYSGNQEIVQILSACTTVNSSTRTAWPNKQQSEYDHTKSLINRYARKNTPPTGSNIVRSPVSVVVTDDETDNPDPDKSDAPRNITENNENKTMEETNKTDQSEGEYIHRKGSSLSRQGTIVLSKTRRRGSPDIDKETPNAINTPMATLAVPSRRQLKSKPIVAKTPDKVANAVTRNTVATPVREKTSLNSSRQTVKTNTAKDKNNGNTAKKLDVPNKSATNVPIKSDTKPRTNTGATSKPDVKSIKPVKKIH